MREYLPLSVWLVLGALVVAELAILIPVIATQRQKDEALVGVELMTRTDDFANRVNQTIARFVYNVVRSAAAAPKVGFLSQTDLADSVQLESDPGSTPEKLYFWVPLVSVAERSGYETFYGFNITQQKNGTGSPIVPIPRDSNRTLFAPYTIFVPMLPPTTNPAIYGFDLLPFNATTTSVIFKNVSTFLSIPSSLIAGSRTQNNYGFVAVAQNKNGRGYMFGRIGSKDLLEFSLTVPRQEVILAAFVLSANASRQALFYDDTPLLGNATSLAIFNALPARSTFYTTSFTTLGEKITVAVRYSDKYAAQFAGNTWVILAAVLAPVCFLIDIIVVVLALLWQRQKKLQVLEENKRKEAQVMISYVNHEIRNPLQTILGLADLELEETQEHKGNCRLADNLKAIIGAAEFIEHIATDILDLRRVEEGKVEVDMSEVNVKQLMNGLAKTVESLQVRKNTVAFKVNADPEIECIYTDRYRLEQIILNFLTNAFKHTAEGVVTLSVSLAGTYWVRFSVWDTGKGIAPEKKEKLFQQFAQVSARDAHDGFGLGLYLTKMLAELLGGHVGFESTLGLGSVFWLELPVHTASAGLLHQFEESRVELQRPRDL